MSEGASGWLWLVIDVGLVAALGIVLAYGTLQYRKRRGPRSLAPELRTSLTQRGCVKRRHVERVRVRFETHRRSVHESLGRSLCYDTVSSFAGLVVAREPTKGAITGFRNGLALKNSHQSKRVMRISLHAKNNTHDAGRNRAFGSNRRRRFAAPPFGCQRCRTSTRDRYFPGKTIGAGPSSMRRLNNLFPPALNESNDDQPALLDDDGGAERCAMSANLHIR